MFFHWTLHALLDSNKPRLFSTALFEARRICKIGEAHRMEQVQSTILFESARGDKGIWWVGAVVERQLGFWWVRVFAFDRRPALRAGVTK